MKDEPQYADEKVIFRTGPSPSKIAPNPTPFDNIEQEIQAKGLAAPRVTPADIEAEIVRVEYFTAAQGVYGREIDLSESVSDPQSEGDPLRLLTFCVLVLRNGFTVTGESACASPENFNAEVGRKIARQKAVEKVWPLLGFRLRDELSLRNSLPTTSF